MKKLSLLFLTPLIFINCKNQEDCIPYFDFDEVEYFYIDISSEEIQNLIYKQRTEKDPNEIMFLNIFTGFYPMGQKDTLNIGKLENFGYSKTQIPEGEFLKINQLFCERKHEFSESAACGYYNRDILIFKKNGNNVGIAKLCFECELNQIIGSKRNTQDFGQSGDFKVLKELLIKYRKK